MIDNYRRLNLSEKNKFNRLYNKYANCPTLFNLPPFSLYLSLSNTGTDYIFYFNVMLVCNYLPAHFSRYFIVKKYFI